MLTCKPYRPPDSRPMARSPNRRPDSPVRRVERGADDIGAGGRALLVVERSVRGAVDGAARLLAPAIRERAGVDGAVPDRVEEFGDGRLGRLAVARYRQVRPVTGPGRPGKVFKVPEEDVVEHLHDLGGGNLMLK